MNELIAIGAAWRDLRAWGEPAVLATLVGVRGSHFRQPGARRLFAASGAGVGVIGGTCLDADLRRRALASLAESRATCVRYDATEPADLLWGLGTGCTGEVEILLTPSTLSLGRALLDGLSGLVEARATATLAVVVRAGTGAELGGSLSVRDGAILDAAGLTAARQRRLVRLLAAPAAPVRRIVDGEVEVHVETVAPPRRLVLCGIGSDALHIARIGCSLGLDVVVLDPRSALQGPEHHAFRLAGARVGKLTDDLSDCDAALVLSHDFRCDLEFLRRLAPVAPRYLGVCGPRQRTELLLAELALDGVFLDAAALHAPAGLDLGAEAPAEIALSALAEILASWRGAAARPLRERDGPIHARPGSASPASASRPSGDAVVTVRASARDRWARS